MSSSSNTGDGDSAGRDRRLVLDVDCGVDDALALMLALSLRRAAVEAVTCVAGNTTVRKVEENVRRVLAVCGCKQVPVYRGCERPLSEPPRLADDYHGADGLGGVADQFPAEADGVGEAEDDGSVDGRPRHAAEVLVEMARREPGQITLVLLGPLTNAALALILDPRIGENLRDIFILGGNVEGRGNVLPGSEYNFMADPEAANVVLTRAGCPITIVPWEAVVKSSIPWEVYSAMTKQDTARSRFVGAITRFGLAYHDKARSEGYEVGDALAVVAALAPDAVTGTLEERRVAVELHGTHTRGQLVQAWTPDLLPDVTRTVRIVTAFDRERVSQLLMRMVA